MSRPRRHEKRSRKPLPKKAPPRMSLVQYLLTLVQEESAELGQRASKASRFGMHEVQVGQSDNNERRMFGELLDLVAVFDVLEERGLITAPEEEWVRAHVEAKKKKIERYLEYSRSLGMVE